MVQKITLSQLNETIKEVLHEAFPTTVWVVAEISELKENRSGHCYLELIEREGESIIARARATIWSYTFRMLKPYFETVTGTKFDSGIKILVQVSVEFHPAFGLSLNIKDIDPAYTVGDLVLQRQEIIKRLQDEGVFDMNKELELPLVPQKIAVISSATAAGLTDFLNQLENNVYGFKFYTKLYEATMQGTETVFSIIHALERIFKHDDFFDCVVIIRGGGAAADLSSFDNYDLSFNVTQFPLPVITGIGHEKDDTIIDLVAHTRMKTPTAVAEFLINGVARFYDRLQELENDIVYFIGNKIETEKNKLERIAEKLNYSVSGYLTARENILNKRGNDLSKKVSQFSLKKEVQLNTLKHHIGTAVALWFVETRNHLIRKHRILKRVTDAALVKENNQLALLQEQVVHSSRKTIFRESERIHLNENAIRLLNPENVLKRGFTITLKEGKVVKKASDLKMHDELETRFIDGTVKSKISKKE